MYPKRNDFASISTSILFHKIQMNICHLVKVIKSDHLSSFKTRNQTNPERIQNVTLMPSKNLGHMDLVDEIESPTER